MTINGEVSIRISLILPSVIRKRTSDFGEIPRPATAGKLRNPTPSRERRRRKKTSACCAPGLRQAGGMTVLCLAVRRRLPEAGQHWTQRSLHHVLLLSPRKIAGLGALQRDGGAQ